MDNQVLPFNPVILWLRFFIRMGLFALALLWPAGTWYWWEAWIIVALWSLFGAVLLVYLLKHDIALLAERMKLVPIQTDQKSWDKALMAVFLILGIALYIVPGFDVMRYGWSNPLPLWMETIAFLIHLPCFLGLAWVMRENTFLAQVVKIDTQRGHHVITTGPYAWVRHPMYSIIIILLFAVPVALGSRYALFLSLLLTLLLILRTYLEDRSLHDELEGYTEYAGRIQYRLFPGIW